MERIKLVHGIGINDADYTVKKVEYYSDDHGKRKSRQTWVCPFYNTWRNMLTRGYSKSLKTDCPTYVGVSVCEEWHRFSTFKAWMEQQDWENKCLDKDLIIKGNKIYSPEACCFLAHNINTFINETTAARGKSLIGTSWREDAQSYMAYCNNPFTNKRDYLGYFKKEIDAHSAWRAKKLEFAKALALTITDNRVATALVDRYENY